MYVVALYHVPLISCNLQQFHKLDIHFSYQSKLKPFLSFQLCVALFSNDGVWGWYAGGTSWLPSAKALPFSQICFCYYRFYIMTVILYYDSHWENDCKVIK